MLVVRRLGDYFCLIITEAKMEIIRIEIIITSDKTIGMSI